MAIVRDTGLTSFPFVTSTTGAGAPPTTLPTSANVQTTSTSGLLVAIATYANYNGGDLGTGSISGGGLTWALVDEIHQSGNTHNVKVWTAPYTSAVNATITLTISSAGTGYALSLTIDALVGADSASIITAKSAAAGAMTLTLSPPAGAYTYIGCAWENDGVTTVTPINANTTEILDTKPFGVGAAVGTSTTTGASTVFGFTETDNFGVRLAFSIPETSGPTTYNSNNTDTSTVVDSNTRFYTGTNTFVSPHWSPIFRDRFSITDAATDRQTSVSATVAEEAMVVDAATYNTGATDTPTVVDSNTVVITQLVGVTDSTTVVVDSNTAGIAGAPVTYDDASSTTVSVSDSNTASVGTGTTVNAGAVSGHWTLAGSPYKVFGDINVPKGSSLTIDPGVEVQFQAAYIFYIYGGIQAVGTSGQRIKFTTLTSDRVVAEGGTKTVGTWVGWKGIRVRGDEGTIGTGSDPLTHGAGNFTLKFCDIDYVDKYNGGTAVHPWDTYLGAFYAHGFYWDDIVLEDIDIHHQRSDGVTLVPGSFEFGANEPHYYRIRIFGSDTKTGQNNGDGFDAMHFNHPLGSNVVGAHFHECAVYDTNNGNSSTPYVAYTWDAKIYLHNVTLGVGANGFGVGTNETDWFLTTQPNDLIARVSDNVDTSAVVDSNTAQIVGTSTSNNVDTSAVVDSNTVAVTWVSANTDTSTVVDSNTVINTWVSANTDTSAVVDSNTVANTWVSQNTDTSAVVDSNVVTLTWVSQNTDTSAVVDSNTIVNTWVSQNTDTSAVVDSNAVTLTWLSANTDTSAVVDSNTAGVGVISANTDTSTVVDSNAVVLTWLSTNTDTAAIVDANTAAAIHTSNNTDTSAIVDSSTWYPVIKLPDTLDPIDRFASTATVNINKMSVGVGQYVEYKVDGGAGGSFDLSTIITAAAAGQFRVLVNGVQVNIIDFNGDASTSNNTDTSAIVDSNAAAKTSPSANTNTSTVADSNTAAKTSAPAVADTASVTDLGEVLTFTPTFSASTPSSATAGDTLTLTVDP